MQGAQACPGGLAAPRAVAHHRSRRPLAPCGLGKGRLWLSPAVGWAGGAGVGEAGRQG